MRKTYFKKRFFKFTILSMLLAVCILTFIFVTPVSASEIAEQGDSVEPYTITFTVPTNENEGSISETLKLVIILTVLSVAPSLLIMLTSFTRILIVLHFVRSALATQTTPPNQILIGLSLFLTFFIMAPVFTEINSTAITPYSQGEINQEEFFDAALLPIRKFMFDQLGSNPKDLRLFLDIAGIEEVETLEEIPTSVLVPAFIINELRIAFIIGFVIYIPFIIIDMVVSSTLMSMGMMMLPPTTISMPFKILLFVLADGWNLIVGEVVKTFTFYS